ncbi:CIS tube protein [Bacteroides heparinolyticus]|uniref:CIS tube protein n=1 Tax=Prevotella heparinolytica TaxID=28113 RepID=UPI0035A146CC
MSAIISESGMKKSGELARLMFSRNADGSKEKPENGKLDFTVMINPESISRALSMQATSNNSAKSKNKGDAYSCNPETISFAFYLDRTNVIPKTQTRHDTQSVDEMIKDFLEVVYKTSSGKPVQSVAIQYGAHVWTVRVNSVTIEYSLFSKEGETLRAKVVCSFTTIDEDASKPNPPRKKQQKPKEMKPQNCICECPPNTVESARESDQDTLYTSSEANYSTYDGREIKV